MQTCFLLFYLCIWAPRMVKAQRSPDRSIASVASNNDFDGNVFLEKFGYLEVEDSSDYSHSHSPDTVRHAVTEFQRFNGLPVTGELNTQTVTKMQQPRCGLPDVIRNRQQPQELRRRGSNRPLAYRAPGEKWDHQDLTYKFNRYSRKLGASRQRRAIANGFRKWSEVTPLTFRHGRGTVDIDITFRRGAHGDGRDNAFDGEGGVLAHAFSPGSDSISGDTHFDEDEDWTMGTEEGINLESLATHEFGHALGLDHSSNPLAVMAPYYAGYDPNFSLHRDDIRGIQSLYGSGSSPAIDGGTYCRLRFDAIEQVDGRIFAFRGAYVYRITAQGATNRQSIHRVFRGAPSSPGAVVYHRNRRKLYIFKGRKVWRFTRNRKDAGYPRDLPSDFWGVRAAFQWRSGSIFLLKNQNIARWAESLTGHVSGYPQATTSRWRGLPASPESAFRASDGNLYVFKHQRYWRFNSLRQLSQGYPKNIRPIWLNCNRPSRINRHSPVLSFLPSN